METFKKYAVIVAGGSGTRMKREQPKQFIELAGKPILMHTLSVFNTDDINIILVLPKDQISVWNELIMKYLFDVTHKVVAGGDTRFQSVKNGLDFIEEEEGLVAIHDGVRPLIELEIIEESFRTAEKYGNAITSLPLNDSIRSVDGIENRLEDRSKFRLIQTPQTFQLNLIKEAFQQNYETSFTDDASVLEKRGHTINLIQGSFQNIKITTPEDLIIAESFLSI